MRFTRTPLLTLAFALAFLSIATPALASTNVTPGYITVDTTWTKAESPYIVYDPIGIPAGVTLTIEPGVVVKMGQGGCNCYVNFGISGTLIAGSASSDERVIFTSVYDDSVGGDSNGDGASTTPAAGDWRTIAVSGGTLILTHVDMKYGGLAVRPFTFFNPFYQRMLTNDSGTMLLDDVDFSFSYGDNASVRQDYNGSTTITNSRFHDAYAGFEQLNLGGTSTILGSTFSSSTVGVLAGGGTLTVASSSFTGSTYGVLNTSATYQVDARQNYWGSPTGPTNAANPSGTGAIAQGNVLFDPWLNQVPGYIPVEPTCLVDCNSNVLFLPGIEASRLYWTDPNCALVNCENKLWVPNRDDDVEKLYMATGTAVLSGVYVKDGDIVFSSPAAGSFYDSFSSNLNHLVATGSIAAWKPIAYDWRQDYETLLAQGKLVDGKINYEQHVPAGENPYIIDEFLKLASSSHNHKVTIIAHSNGGLLAKALIEKLNQEGKANLIENFVIVASPQLGTPHAIGALLHGYDPTHMKFVVRRPTQRTLSHDMPMAYNLLPSESYIHTVSTPVVKFDTDVVPAHNMWGDEITTTNEYLSFLLGLDNRPNPVTDEINDPAIANETLLNRSLEWHRNYDNWVPPDGIHVIQIAGWGIDTVSGIHYSNDAWFGGFSWSYEPEITEDGDGIVVTPSALGISGAEKYWVDLSQLAKDGAGQNKHADILNVPQIDDFIINNIITHSTTTLPTYFLKNRPVANNLDKRLMYFLHSPLSLSVRDANGNEISKSTSTIPGAYYAEFGDVKYISVPESGPTTLIMNGEGSGVFTLNIKERQGELVVSTTTFANVPVSTSTKVTMDIPAGVSIKQLSGLRVDQNGDGVVDIIVVPGSIISPDLTPPTTLASTTGTLGTNGWYTSNILVTLTATDTSSGVASTTYSLNGGAIWNAYIAPISVTTEGTTTLIYYSTDKAGNSEATNTLALKIDRSAPEASISVSTGAQDILVEGTDNLGTTTVAKDSSGNVTLTDQAGHTTKLFFQKTYTGKQLTYAKLTGVQYDAQPKVILPSSSFLYIWDTKLPVTLLSQTIAVDNTYLIQAKYDKSKNKTTIVVLKKNLSIQSQTYTGLKIVKLTTIKGVVGYSW